MTPELMEAAELQKTLEFRSNEVNRLLEQVNSLNQQIVLKQNELKNLERQLIVTSDEIQMEDFGLYRPRYNFASALGYKEALSDIREKQKEMIKNDAACDYVQWTVDGSLAKGKKMTRDNVKQILRSFNSECEATISSVKHSNYESCKKRINR